MRIKLNCPNCGAPIADVRCPYCGSMFYDFATLDSSKPTYIRIRWNDQIVTARAVMRSATISVDVDSLPELNIDFTIVPDHNGVGLKTERMYDEGDDIPEACRACPSHPRNGGSGICHCTLGTPTIY